MLTRRKFFSGVGALVFGVAAVVAGFKVAEGRVLFTKMNFYPDMKLGHIVEFVESRDGGGITYNYVYCNQQGTRYPLAAHNNLIQPWML